MPTTIYALCEPDLQVPVIRYIGKTVKKAKFRLREHLNQSVKKKSHLGHWLASLRSRGETPVLMELTEVPDEMGSQAEILYIRLAREGGMDLVNATEGGEGPLGMRHSPQSRAAISYAMTGDRHPRYGTFHTEESKEANRAAHIGEKSVWFGKHHSEETKAKMSEARRSQWVFRKLPFFTDGSGI